MALSIFVPIAYIATLFAALAAFSKVYRRRETLRLQEYQEASSAKNEVNAERAIYNTLADVQEEFPDGGADDSGWVVPRATLQGALLARAVNVLKSMNDLRSDKQALATLLERGSVGDDAAVLLETMDNDIRKEVMAIVREAGRLTRAGASSSSKVRTRSCPTYATATSCSTLASSARKRRPRHARWVFLYQK